jgi:hypothetical protein
MTTVISALVASFALVGAVCGTGSGGDHSTPESQSEEATLVGMFIDTSQCGYEREFCGPLYQLRDEALDATTPLAFEGDTLPPVRSELIVRVNGHFEGPVFVVTSVSKLSEIQYHAFLVEAAGTYFVDHYPCRAGIDPFGNKYTLGDKTFSWEYTDGTPILKARMTDTFAFEYPQPYIELSFDGRDGAFIGEQRVPDTDPCAGASDRGREPDGPLNL